MGFGFGLGFGFGFGFGFGLGLGFGFGLGFGSRVRVGVHLDVEHGARVLDEHLGLVRVVGLDVEVLREAAGKHAPDAVRVELERLAW